MDTLVVVHPIELFSFRFLPEEARRRLINAFFVHAGIPLVAIKTVLRCVNHPINVSMIRGFLSGHGYTLSRFYKDRLESFYINCVFHSEKLVQEWSLGNHLGIRQFFNANGTTRFGYCPMVFRGQACYCWPDNTIDRMVVFDEQTALDSRRNFENVFNFLTQGVINPR